MNWTHLASPPGPPANVCACPQLLPAFAQSFISAASIFFPTKETKPGIVVWCVPHESQEASLNWKLQIFKKKSCHKSHLARKEEDRAVLSLLLCYSLPQPALLLWWENKWKANSLWQQLFLAWPSGAWVSGWRGIEAAVCAWELNPDLCWGVKCFELRLRGARWDGGRRQDVFRLWWMITRALFSSCLSCANQTDQWQQLLCINISRSLSSDLLLATLIFSLFSRS